MTIKGGVNINNNEIVLSLTIDGGRPYNRVYNDVVSSAINAFESNSQSLDINYKDPIYIRQLKYMFQYAHVDIISGTSDFQLNYNIWMLYSYVRMLLSSHDMKLISQLLNLDSILYSVEEAGVMNNHKVNTDFTLPSRLIIDTSKIHISTAKSNSVKDVSKSLNANIHELITFIKRNEDAFKQIHMAIVKQASKHLSK